MNDEDKEVLQAAIDKAADDGVSVFPNMTYEEGIRDCMAIMEGEFTAEELLG